ncbi:hypothetical protein [Phaeobacter sp. C3_T13_0]|uniref:hypothetical protein n=1 Tax=Phaeobacter cretensis TaxID=3342641 RepID=UPI0039BD404C
MTDTPSHAETYQYTRTARSPRLIFAVCLWAAAVLGMFVLLSAAVWITAILILPLLPGLWELWRNPTALFNLDKTRLYWRNASGATEIPLGQISHIRLDKRWDFSHRATVHMTDGKRLRIPPDCQPPHRALEQAVTAVGVRVVRHHFRIY